MPEPQRCSFCGGALGATETQRHSNPNFAQYKTCLSCGYQWAKEYWDWLLRQEEQGVIQKPSCNCLRDCCCSFQKSEMSSGALICDNSSEYRKDGRCFML